MPAAATEGGDHKQTCSFKYRLGPLRIKLEGVPLSILVILSALIICCSTFVIYELMVLLFSNSFVIPATFLFVLWIGCRFSNKIFGTKKKAEVEITSIQNDLVKTEKKLEIRKLEIEAHMQRLEAAERRRHEHQAAIEGPTSLLDFIRPFIMNIQKRN